MNEKISIIVPVYKVERYLDRCVDSLVNQTWRNIEIILVDDGSPDSCPALCDEWAKRDERIKVVHKENAGLGMARNSGLDVMTGDFVMFVDSDDFIHQSTCETALQSLCENDGDVCYYSCVNIFPKSKPPKAKTTDFETSVYEGDDVIGVFLTESLAPPATSNFASINTGVSACMALYRATVIRDNNVRFYSERDYLNEDYHFRIDFCRFAKKVVVLDAEFYCYYHHSGTLTTAYNEHHFDDSVTMYKKGAEVLASFENDELLLRNTRFFMTNVISCFKHEAAFSKSYFELSKKLRYYCKNKTLQSALKGYPLRSLPATQKAFFYAIRLKSPLMIYALIKLKFKLSKN